MTTFVERVAPASVHPLALGAVAAGALDLAAGLAIRLWDGIEGRPRALESLASFEHGMNTICWLFAAWFLVLVVIGLVRRADVLHARVGSLGARAQVLVVVGLLLATAGEALNRLQPSPPFTLANLLFGGGGTF
jgi:hypothetical protein